jgi:hypothetical protein
MHLAGTQPTYAEVCTILREYIQPKRALRSGKDTLRFETVPDEQLQSDWGEIVTEIGGEPSRFTRKDLRKKMAWCSSLISDPEPVRVVLNNQIAVENKSNSFWI